EEAAALLRWEGEGWGPVDLEDALKPFYEEYDHIVFNHRARSHDLVTFENPEPGLWIVTQVLIDSEDDNMWYLKGNVDLSKIASDTTRLFALDHIGD
ncbi:MAG: DUF3516 domain-containing protein, partial [Myxococcota bacterium]|nr:DUF3516 domain-containing protein [Myxococcota bacterium]